MNRWVVLLLARVAMCNGVARRADSLSLPLLRMTMQKREAGAMFDPWNVGRENGMRFLLQLPVIVALLIQTTTAVSQISNPELIAQAKKEGRVVWYTTVSIPDSTVFGDRLGEE